MMQSKGAYDKEGGLNRKFNVHHDYFSKYSRDGSWMVNQYSVDATTYEQTSNKQTFIPITKENLLWLAFIGNDLDLGLLTSENIVYGTVTNKKENQRVKNTRKFVKQRIT